MRLSETENTIINAMARAFFVCAWADLQQDRGKTYPSQELMDIAPKTPRLAREFALIFTGELQNANRLGLLVLLNEAAYADVFLAHGWKWNGVKFVATDKAVESVPKYRFQHPQLTGDVEALKTDKYISDFGHYLAMQGLGHGVSWFDDHANFKLVVPSTEFYL